MNLNQFAKRLTQCRIQKGYTLSQVSFYLHISKSLLSNYEHGIRYPNSRNLIALANFFHVTTDYLLGIDTLTIPTSYFLIPVYDCHQQLLYHRAIQSAYKDSFYFKQRHFLYLIIKIRTFQSGDRVLISHRQILQLGTIVHHEHHFYVQLNHTKNTSLLSIERSKDNILGIVSEIIELLDEVKS